jgi:hypothetical protein
MANRVTAVFEWGNREKDLDDSTTVAWLETSMARLLIVKPAASFHILFHAGLAQAGYVAIEAANSYEGRPAADVVCLGDGRRDRRTPARARLLIVEAAAQFHALFCEVLAQEGYVVTEAVHRAAGLAAADAAGRADGRMGLRYLVVY